MRVALCIVCDELNELNADLRCETCATYGPRPFARPVKYWTMIDGSEIEIVKMDTGHLANTIAMLARKAQTKPLTSYEERAQLAMQAEYDSRADEIGRMASILSVLLRKAGEP